MGFPIILSFNPSIYQAIIALLTLPNRIKRVVFLFCNFKLALAYLKSIFLELRIQMILFLRVK